MGQPTNSHGGVNFNRVNKSLRISHQAGLGNGRPMNPKQNVNLQPSQANHRPQMPLQAHNQINLASLPLPNQSMMMGMFPMGEWQCRRAIPYDLVDPSIPWPVPVDFPLSEYCECPLSQQARYLTKVSRLHIRTTPFGPRLSNERQVAHRRLK